jgi:hypothetical protein
MKQTALEWFNQEINKLNVGTDARVFIAKLFKKAKEMEKQQIIDAYAEAEDNCEWLIEEHKWQRFHSEQYYNKTYNK